MPSLLGDENACTTLHWGTIRWETTMRRGSSIVRRDWCPYLYGSYQPPFEPFQSFCWTRSRQTYSHRVFRNLLTKRLHEVRLVSLFIIDPTLTIDTPSRLSVIASRRLHWHGPRWRSCPTRRASPHRPRTPRNSQMITARRLTRLICPSRFYDTLCIHELASLTRMPRMDD